ncbi:MAG: polysaccharide biosynthesis C-terminal domain-containing protein [Bacteroidales bacterium]
MKEFKRLAGQTLVYGLGTIVPRVFNYLVFTWFFTRVFSKYEYGVFTELYGQVAFLLVFLTYGMETTYFRFLKDKFPRGTVYSTALRTLAFTSGFFLVLIFLFYQDFARWIAYPNRPLLVLLLGIVVAIDAFISLPFAKLRAENRAMRFGMLKIINVIIIIFFNLFFLAGLPYLDTHFSSSLISFLYVPEWGVEYAFISNLLGSGSMLLLLFKDIKPIRIKGNPELRRQMLTYTFPLLVVGSAGMINEVFDKILLKYLLDGTRAASEQVGVYGANYRIAVLMTLFIQMFRYAAEPFYFDKMRDKDAKQTYATVMKYFVIFGLLIFLGVMFYIDIVKYFIGPDFRSGLHIVPIVLIANLFLGIIYNLSVWYKLTNKTKFGAYIALFGAAITLVLNIVLVPVMGYEGAAWATLICYFSMMIVSYLLSRRHYAIPYDLKSIGGYFFFAVTLYFITNSVHLSSDLLKYLFHTLLLALFIIIIERREHLIRQIRAK